MRTCKNIRKTITIVGIASVFIYSILASICIYRMTRSQEYIPLSYGNSIDGQVIHKFSEIDDHSTETPEYSLYIAITDSCGACLDTIDGINNISAVLESAGIDVCYILNEKPTERQIRSLNLNPDDIYYSDNSVKITSSYPTFYLARGETVIYRDYTLYNVFEKLCSIDSSLANKLMNSSVSLLREKYCASNKCIIYFCMSGCQDCEEADELLGDDVFSQYDIIRIYKYNEKQESGKVIDQYGFFKHTLGITWYPSFIIFCEEGYRFVGRTDVTELRSVLCP